MKALGVTLAWTGIWCVLFSALILGLTMLVGESVEGQVQVPAAGKALAWCMLLAAGALGARRGARRTAKGQARLRVVVGIAAGLLAPVIGVAMLVPLLVHLQFSMDLSVGDAMPADHWLVLMLFAVSIGAAVAAALAAGPGAD
jgi:hypothetical protein